MPTINISNELKEMLNEEGHKGETYEIILRRLLKNGFIQKEEGEERKI